MTIEEIKNLCIKSSSFYYNFLEENGRGIKVIRVLEKTFINNSRPIWRLRLASRLFSTDYIKIKNTLNNDEYDTNLFSVVEYDSEAKLIWIKFNDQTTFDEVNVEDLQVIYDLKFLVKNVENWFITNGMMLRGLSTPQNHQPTNPQNILNVNSNQSSAIQSILNNKYNYVWGPPGTGKTHFVLSSSLFQMYQKNNAKIGVFAPTNNALEEALKALLEQFENEGIEKKDVLRVGAPSVSFLIKFPECCEIQGVENRIIEVQNTINRLNRIVEYRRGQTVFNSLSSTFNLFDLIKQNLSKLKDLRSRESILNQENAEYEKILNSTINKIKNFLGLSVLDLTTKRDKNIKEMESITKKKKLLLKECSVFLLQIKETQIESERISTLLQSINTTNFLEKEEELSHISEEIAEYLTINEELSREYEGENDVGLQSLIEHHSAELPLLEELSFDHRIAGCSIIGMTLDAYVGRCLNFGIPFTHIFLDEAGYAPLIKTLPLFSNDCGITLLGDHKQLAPVCEMDENVIGNNEEHMFYFLWSKPSLFTEPFFSLSKEKSCEILAETDIPPFLHTKLSILTESHRFGQNLAELLDDLVYDNIGFKAVNENNNVDLCFINAPGPGIHKRTSPSECAAISNHLRNHHLNDFCILTPYRRDQVSYLRKNLENTYRDIILTIHESQGREWGTVILSVVDGIPPNHPWFTDSTIQQNKPILNTAISRVKQKLIIVCDVNYWRNRSDSNQQLISNLLNISTELHI